MSKPSILVTHPWMERGGSEATAMWTLQALQDDYDVTFATASPMNWGELNEAYGSSVDPGKIQQIRAPRLPTVDNARKLVAAQVRWFERFCHRIAGRFDLCISSYNPVDFGRPGIQLIGDFSFSEEMRKRLYIHGESRFCHQETFLRRAYLAGSALVGIRNRPLRERKDLILANSRWCVGQLEEFFQVPEAPVIYPPVILPQAPADAVRDPLGFVCLGRVVPEKEIERMIAILEAVRERGFSVTLRLIGSLDDSEYSRKIGGLIAEKDWIVPEGFLTLEKKQQILASMTYAIHGCRIEAFGIAVAEMASMGCVPFVPDTGGAGEIVPFPELQFATEEEAVEKIIDLLDHPDKAAEFRSRLSGQMDRFGPDVFMRELREHVLGFFGDRTVAGASPASDASPSKNLAAIG
jgi:glycosyltransferase involved in cell wall biosynthesis